MAKTLDKLLSNKSQKLVKLRQQYDWLVEEREGLEDKYNAKKQKELGAFAAKADEKLKSAAYKACDKTEYAENDFAEKLQKYDVNAYMSQRAVNHGAAKKIYKAVRSGELDKIAEILKEKDVKLDALNKKRQAFIETLEAKKEAFIASNKGSDASEFNMLKSQLDAEYAQLEKAVNEKYDAKLNAEKAKLSSKIDKIQNKISGIISTLDSEYKLPDDVLLEVKGLKMYFGGLKAVDDLTFNVKKGEIFGLIGPNGAGKTTVFNCITRFYDATGGDMHFENKYGEVVNLRDFKVHDVILQGISRTFQNLEVVKEVSVLDNLLIAATRQYTSNLFVQMTHLPLLSREEKIIKARADRILKYMGLSAYRDRLAWGLPYGVLKRIEIARALMGNPKLIILDEPAAGLNESETTDLANLINKIREDFGCTILLVEHDMSLVMNICDHICAISFGRKLAYGTAKEIQASKEVQEAYLGTGGDE